MRCCGTGCLKQGKPAGLLTKEKRFHILDAPSLLLAPYVGQELRVTGFDYNGVISGKKAEVRKDIGWEEIDIKSLTPASLPVWINALCPSSGRFDQWNMQPKQVFVAASDGE
jgi:hypothetical protein